MDNYSTLDKKLAQAVPETASPVPASSNPAATTTGAAPGPALVREGLRFPGEDGGKSLSEMAQRDLDATLQLLAERAQYITGASGAAIALREGENMICCASAGPSAPELGTHLQIDSGLSAESVRTRKILHCDDAENDPRVNRESCRAFGIASVAVMPLARGEEVYGVFELLAGRPRAFEERDFLALQRLSEMIQTALEHAEAARRAETEWGGTPAAAAKGETAAMNPARQPVGNSATTLEKQAPTTESKPAPEAAANPNSTPAAAPVLAPDALAEMIEAKIGEVKPEEANEPRPITPIAYGNVRTCKACGFPVSAGRRLCLDCEAVTPNVEPGGEAPEFFGELSDPNPSWVQSHVYMIATVLLVAATIAVVVWRF